MTTRRNLLKAAALSGAALGLAREAQAQSAQPPQGHLCVLVYGKSRHRMPDGHKSSIVTIDVSTYETRTIHSTVPNLHGLLRAGPGLAQVWGIGHESPERLEVFDSQLNRLEVRTYPGFTFRGHGIAWRGGVLVSAERTADPMAGGVLLEIDAQGTCVGQHPTGGLRPHEIVVCGEYFAVAHYGHRPATLGPGVPGQPAAGGLPMLFDTVSPGVSFLKRDTLEVVAFHRMPGAAATTHLGVTAAGQVLAMGINTARVPVEATLYEMAARDEATLLPSEWYERGYEVYAPMFRVDPLKGVVQIISEGAARMRRGQSFSSDARAGLVVATYAASQTLFVQRPGQPDRWLNTLEFGVPNPRGCALLPDTNLVAVSGNEDNVAIVDTTTGKLVRLVGVPLGGHSHMFWVPA